MYFWKYCIIVVVPVNLTIFWVSVHIVLLLRRRLMRRHVVRHEGTHLRWPLSWRGSDPIKLTYNNAVCQQFWLKGQLVTKNEQASVMKVNHMIMSFFPCHLIFAVGYFPFLFLFWILASAVVICYIFHCLLMFLVQVGPKISKPLPNYQNIVLNRNKVCQWD